MTANTLRIALLAALAAAPFACAKQRAAEGGPSSPAGDHALDGKTFSGTVKLAGSDGGDPDTLVFDAGRLESTACTKLGFEPGKYRESREGDAIVFTAVSHTDGGAEMQWKGTIEDDLARATASWSMPGKPARTYEFEGSLKDGGAR